MVVMAQDYGADVRLVALMQYLRVLFVAGAAALVVRFAPGGEAQEMNQQIVWFPAISGQLPLTLLLTAAAGWLGLRMRFPSGVMLLPMLAGALVQGEGWLMLELPEWLLALAYAAVGWSVGLKFNRAIFLLALKTLPQILASIIGLILLCSLMAFGLTQVLPLDFMTAYLATSPGRPGYGGDYCGGNASRYVVYHGDADPAPVHHLIDRSGDCAVYLPLCAAKRKKPPINEGLEHAGRA
jgi:membrane AbrB-like protein